MQAEYKLRGNVREGELRNLKTAVPQRGHRLYSGCDAMQAEYKLRGNVREGELRNLK